MDVESGNDEKDGLTNEEVNRDNTGEADEMNPEVDSKDDRDAYLNTVSDL